MKNTYSSAFVICAVLFSVCLILSNLMEIKVIEVAGIPLTCGLLIFPISYVLNDCITEVWGYTSARKVIFIGFAMNLFVVLVGLLAVALPAASFWEGEPHFNYIFRSAPRMVLASMAAFLTGSLLNAKVMSVMKRNTVKEDKTSTKGFSSRAILSTLIGETSDSVIFFPIAFAGIVPWQDLIFMALVQIILKSLYEIVILPLTLRLVKRLQKIENAVITK